MKKIHLLCHILCHKDILRDSLRYIKFKHDKCMATDAHIGAIMHTEDVMPNVVQEGEELYILGEDWKNSKAYDAMGFQRNGDQVVVIGKGGRTSFIQTRKDIKFPDLKSAIPSDFSTSVPAIGLNGKMYATLLDAIGCKAAVMKFSAQNKAIKVEPINLPSISPVLAVIMPSAIPVS